MTTLKDVETINKFQINANNSLSRESNIIQIKSVLKESTTLFKSSSLRFNSQYYCISFNFILNLNDLFSLTNA